MAFARFMSRPAGRLARVVAGIVMIAVGVALGGGWWILAVAGLLPLAAGAFDLCLIAPLLRAPFRGRDAARTGPG
jgi:hypothetical protein